MTQTELITTDARIEVTPIALMQQVIAGGLTADSVGVMERLVNLDREMRKDHAERAFAQAFAALQKETPSIRATRPVPNNDGTIRYCYAPYEEIWEAVRPLLNAHGFAITYSSELKEDTVTVHCTLLHGEGHQRTNSATVKASAPPKSTVTQGSGASMTYAKRFALCDCLNINVTRDTDARDEGDGEVISEDQAIYLREQVAATKSNEAAFLKFAGVGKYEDIPKARYQELYRMLAKKAV
jgi:hypothetical protein